MKSPSQSVGGTRQHGNDKSQPYNTAAIRQLLTEALSDEDLTFCCYDYFRAVYRQFSAGMSFKAKVQRLIEYCERHALFEKLLYLVQDLNPNKFTQFAPQIGISLDRPPADISVHLDIELPYGTMRPDSKFYIERSADKDCWTHISSDRAVTLFVQAPRQMGKSSLMRRMIDRAGKEQNTDCVFIDFEKFPEEHLANEEEFLIEFCLMIGDELGIPPAIEQYWQGRRTNIYKCSNYLSGYILPQIEKSMILAMDEVERLLDSPFRANFFGMLRTWVNDRVIDENLNKMSMFLSSATEPFLLIDNYYQSPFNVAEPIDLQDFTNAEVHQLNQRHNNILTSEQVDALVQVIGGHPYLVRRAFYLIATGKTDFDTLLSNATSDTGPFEDHLAYYLYKVLQKPTLKQAVAHISRHQNCTENRTYYRLKEAGLIKKDGEQVVLRNQLYARYFAERL